MSRNVPSSEGRRIVAFYEGSALDDRGRRHAEILRFDDDALEEVHDFIQWLFPMRERSGANPAAPRLDDATIAAFIARPDLQAALRASLERMLRFYGLAREGDVIVRAASFATRAKKWCTPDNHNHLRLTRMLTSLRELGDAQSARALLACLEEIARDERMTYPNPSQRTLRYWHEAAYPTT